MTPETLLVIHPEAHVIRRTIAALAISTDLHYDLVIPSSRTTEFQTTRDLGIVRSTLQASMGDSPFSGFIVTPTSIIQVNSTHEGAHHAVHDRLER